MNDLTYQELRRRFEEDRSSFDDLVERYKCDKKLRREVIGVLANLDRESKIREADGPLRILTEIDPELGRAIRLWTSRRFAEMRAAQEKGEGPFFDEVRCLESGLSHLPLWKRAVRHTSRDKLHWQGLLSGGKLELKSFLSCSRPGYTTAYSFNLTLIFRNLRNARLLGSLSAEHGEGEVIIPRGAQFEVVETQAAEITLKQVGH